MVGYIPGELDILDQNIVKDFTILKQTVLVLIIELCGPFGCFPGQNN